MNYGQMLPRIVFFDIPTLGWFKQDDFWILQWGTEHKRREIKNKNYFFLITFSASGLGFKFLVFFEKFFENYFIFLVMYKNIRNLSIIDKPDIFRTFLYL